MVVNFADDVILTVKRSLRIPRRGRVVQMAVIQAFRNLVMCLALIMTCCPQPGWCQASQADVSVSFTSASVEIPAAFRTLHAHPDDGGGRTGTIARSNYRSGPVPSLGVVTRILGDRSTSLSFGARVVFGFVGDIAEYNYTNAVGTGQRGYGAALTFVGIQVAGPLPIGRSSNGVSLTPEVQIRHRLERRQAIFVGVSYLRVNMVNGWDRYDNLEWHETREIGHLFPVTIGYEWRPIRLAFQSVLAARKVRCRGGLSLSYVQPF